MITLTTFKSKLIPEETLKKMVRILKAVAHLGRLQIMNILINGECQVSEIRKSMGIKLSLTSHLLSNLKFDGIVKSRKDENKVYYSLANDSIKKIMKSIIAEI